MYESFRLVGIQLLEKYKENFDVSSEGTSTCTVSVCIYASYLTFTDKYNLLKQRFFQGFFRTVKRPQKLNLELSFETQSSHRKIQCSKKEVV